MKPEKGTYVSRSIYQKVVGENRQLLHDLNILTREESNPPSYERLEVIKKWQTKFKKEKRFSQMLQLGLQAFAEQFKKDHPEYTAMASKSNSKSKNK